MVVRWSLRRGRLGHGEHVRVERLGGGQHGDAVLGERLLVGRDGGGDVVARRLGVAAVEEAEQRRRVVRLQVDLPLLDRRAPRWRGCPGRA